MSDPVKRDPILDHYSMITRLYSRVNGLKTIPFTSANTRIANVSDNPPPPGFGLRLNVIKHFEDFEQLQMYLSGSTTQLLHLLLPLRTNQAEAKMRFT